MKTLLLLILAIFITVGCGGNGSNPPRSGSIRMLIQWPSTRDIPPSTRSIKVLARTLVKNEAGAWVEDKQVGERVVSRPEGETTSTVTLDDLPSVRVRVHATAYASTDGSGTPIALGVKDADIASGETASITITLHGDIASIDATPESLTVGVGATTTLALQGKDSSGSPVIIEDSRWEFVSANSGIATVVKRASPNGHIADVNGVAEGSTTIQVRDTLTGLTLDVPVTVGTGGGEELPTGGWHKSDHTWTFNGTETQKRATRFFIARPIEDLGQPLGAFQVARNVDGEEVLITMFGVYLKPVGGGFFEGENSGPIFGSAGGRVFVRAKVLPNGWLRIRWEAVIHANGERIVGDEDIPPWP